MEHEDRDNHCREHDEQRNPKRPTGSIRTQTARNEP
jgi:hypothetical protein